jgi:hypothetical protein
MGETSDELGQLAGGDVLEVDENVLECALR